MVRAGKIDLAKLSIVALVDAFGAALESALSAPGARPPLAQWGDWLVMAATLALLRSRLLLPEAAQDARVARSEAEALRQLLIERVQIGAAADWLTGRPQLGREVFARATLQIGAPDRRDNRPMARAAGAGESGRAGDVVALLRACLVALRLPDGDTAYRPPPPKLWRMADALAQLEKLLGTVPDGSPLTEFLPSIAVDGPARDLRCRSAITGTFVAGLELARGGTLTLQQNNHWQPIAVHRPAGAMAPGQDPASSAAVA